MVSEIFKKPLKMYNETRGLVNSTVIRKKTNEHRRKYKEAWMAISIRV